MRRRSGAARCGRAATATVLCTFAVAGCANPNARGPFGLDDSSADVRAVFDDVGQELGPETGPGAGLGTGLDAGLFDVSTRDATTANVGGEPSFEAGDSAGLADVLEADTDAHSANPTVVENGAAGTSDWQLTNPALGREVEGYASRTSVNVGGSLSILASTAETTYTIDVFRMGYYNGLGGRRMMPTVTRPGILQATPAPGVDGLIECRWTNPYTFDIPGTWVSGVYLALLTGKASGKQSFVIFVVRDDARASDYIFQSSVTTYQAYNNWGGKSLYDFNSMGMARGYKVSFDRPYAIGYNTAEAAYGVGAGEFLTNLQGPAQTAAAGWEYPMVRFIEREGYDVTYATDVDTHEDPNLLAIHKGFLSVGHNEYWSFQMRDNVERARDRNATGIGFFSGNDCYWQVRFEPGIASGPDRTIVCYKDAALDPASVGPDPQLVTVRWGEPQLNHSEAELVGVTFQQFGVDGDLVVDDVASWPFADSGLRQGNHVSGLLGYEVDGLPGDMRLGMHRLAHSPWNAGGTSGASDMVTYTVPSGADVFAAGSIQFSWGLDDFTPMGVVRSSRVSTAAQQVARNVLSRFTAPRTSAPDAPSLVTDDFAGTLRDPTKWSLGTIAEGSAAFDANVAVSQGSQELDVALLGGLAGLHHGGYLAAHTWDFTGGSASIDLTQAPNQATAADTTFALSIDPANWCRFVLESGTLLFESSAAGVTTSTRVAYDPAQHRRLRLRHETSTDSLVWETSPNGVVWNVARRAPTPIAVTALRPEIEAGTYQPETAPGVARFANFAMDFRGFGDVFATGRDPTKWVPDVVSEGPSAYDPNVGLFQYSGALHIVSIANVSGIHHGGYRSVQTWDVTGGSAEVEVPRVASGLADTTFALSIDSSNWVRFTAENGVLYFIDSVSGVRAVASVSYDPVLHLRWRFRHDTSTGSLRWETSPDGATWTVQRTIPVPIALTGVRAELESGTSRSEMSPGRATFRNFRLGH